MQIKETVATTTATAERVFSAMNRICTNLRASTSADRLEKLVIIAMNKEMVPNIDIDVLINAWARQKNRRLQI